MNTPKINKYNELVTKPHNKKKRGPETDVLTG